VAEANAPDAVFHTTEEVMRHTDEIVAHVQTRTQAP
jgi:hypothetical protein